MSSWANSAETAPTCGATRAPTASHARARKAIFFPFIVWLQWQRLTRRYAINLEFLAGLEKLYGDDLPWLQVERHFAALEALQAELAAEAAREPK